MLIQAVEEAAAATSTDGGSWWLTHWPIVHTLVFAFSAAVLPVWLHKSARRREEREKEFERELQKRAKELEHALGIVRETSRALNRCFCTFSELVKVLAREAKAEGATNPRERNELVSEFRRRLDDLFALRLLISSTEAACLVPENASVDYDIICFLLEDVKSACASLVQRIDAGDEAALEGYRRSEAKVMRGKIEHLRNTLFPLDHGRRELVESEFQAPECELTTALQILVRELRLRSEEILARILRAEFRPPVGHRTHILCCICRVGGP